ncbi:MAG: hypothetical protein C5B50_27120, partial [Verrucomicrobia bacterium]
FQPAKRPKFLTRLAYARSADWKSAIQQVGNLRYFFDYRGASRKGKRRPSHFPAFIFSIQYLH